MRKIDKEAAREFKKLSKKEQRRINKLKRIPTPPTGAVFDKKDIPRKKQWEEDSD